MYIIYKTIYIYILVQYFSRLVGYLQNFPPSRPWSGKMEALRLLEESPTDLIDLTPKGSPFWWLPLVMEKNVLDSWLFKIYFKNWNPYRKCCELWYVVKCCAWAPTPGFVRLVEKPTAAHSCSKPHSFFDSLANLLRLIFHYSFHSFLTVFFGVPSSLILIPLKKLFQGVQISNQPALVANICESLAPVIIHVETTDQTPVHSKNGAEGWSSKQWSFRLQMVTPQSIKQLDCQPFGKPSGVHIIFQGCQGWLKSQAPGGNIFHPHFWCW